MLICGSDQGGFSLKNEIIAALDNQLLLDLGVFTPHISVDYPDVAQKLADHFIALSCYPKKFGLLICRSGIGIAIAANRFPWIRAAVCKNQDEVRLARTHNDANVLALGAGFTSIRDAVHLIRTFTVIEFEGGRHINRVRKLSSLPFKI